MTTSMVTQDAATFVALGQAMSLAAAEGALDGEGARDLNAALVAAILTGCMELDTYARVHETLARMLEMAFARDAARDLPAAAARGGAAAVTDDSLGVYLEVVGEAWEKVNGEEEVCIRVRSFALACFDLDRTSFGGEAWFQAPLRVPMEELIRRAKAAGLLILSLEPTPATELTASLRDPALAPAADAVGHLVLGWGERRVALSLERTG